MLKKQDEFFSNLCKPQGLSVENSNCDIFFNSVDLTTLPEQMSGGCESVITENECLLALNEFKNGKSPGLDGFTAEFHKFFWNDLSENLILSLNYAFEKGKPSIC